MTTRFGGDSESGAAHTVQWWVFLPTASACILALAAELLLDRAGTSALERPIFQRLFLAHDTTAAWIWLAMLPVLWLVARTDVGPGLVGLVSRHPVSSSAVLLASLAAGSMFGYRKHPLSMDEFSPVFQATIFATGELAGQMPPDLVRRAVPFLDYFFTASDSGQVVSAYWPGMSVLLMPFARAGVPWLANPVLGWLTATVLWRLGLRLFGTREAAATLSFLSVASPFFFVNAISFYAVTAHILCSALFVLLLLDATRMRALLAGLVGSFALLLQNPVPHAAFAIPWLVAHVVVRERRSNALPLALGYLPGVAVLFAWALLRGSLRGESADAAVEVGLVSRIVALLGSGFGFPDADLLGARFIGVLKLVLWAVPALPFVAILGYLSRRELIFQLLLASAGTTFVVYLFVPFDQGHGWGFRYFQAAWLVLPILACAWLQTSPPPWRRTVVSMALVSAIVFVPVRCLQVRSFIDDHLALLPPLDRSRFQVVLVKSFPALHSEDLVQNDPFLRSRTWYFISGGDDEAFLAEHFPRARPAGATGVASVWTVDDF